MQKHPESQQDFTKVGFNWNAKNPSGDDNPDFSKKFSISIH